MGCYYHPAVPTAVRCRDCGNEICASCSLDAICPGCRLGRAIRREAPTARMIATATDRPADQGRSEASAAAVPQAERPEDRLVAAVGYPFWPLALLLLFLPSRRSSFARFHVVQALGVNALGVAVYLLSILTAHLPVIGWQSAVLLPFLVPIWFVVDLYLAVRAYGGHMTRVPIAADYAQRFAA